VEVTGALIAAGREGNAGNCAAATAFGKIRQRSNFGSPRLLSTLRIVMREMKKL
jgi:hypothetical protein